MSTKNNMQIQRNFNEMNMVFKNLSRSNKKFLSEYIKYKRLTKPFTKESYEPDINKIENFYDYHNILHDLSYDIFTSTKTLRNKLLKLREKLSSIK